MGNHFKSTNWLMAVILLAFTLAAAPASSNTAADTAESRNEAIVREAFDGWSKGENVFRILSPQVKWTIMGSGPIAGVYNSRDDLVGRGAGPLVSRLAGPLKPVLHHVWASGDKVIIRFDASAPTSSGATYSNSFVWIFTMKDGEVTEAEAFLDLVAYQDVLDNNSPRSQ
ncbi:nuclear transport factor 2 family protein [Phyllobacterium sp. 21LDTY02-6]|uniref:nuclear transport factor 2 family protein n=1 Tax=Phyllobacterium sp. 21LDTY02-6 TaxID=2944903 RepID=UPI0020226913|nr:nuclear transport factor 2 family protein [Phyllobacterium sp. 21LDTY02-6]MCO4317725.1 nuclear transport factor 2 family protein [Phyllobacterium sp. 21LDTY02-6]